MNRRVRKRPEGSITTDEKERNTYLLMKYKERVDWMVQNNQVEKSGLCDYQIVCDGLTENETVFGMKRLTVGVVRAGEEQSSLFVSSVEYHLENPLWKHVVVHLHKGEYEAISTVGEDRRFHIYVPYLFEEGDLVEFMKANLKRPTEVTPTEKLFQVDSMEDEELPDDLQVLNLDKPTVITEDDLFGFEDDDSSDLF